MFRFQVFRALSLAQSTTVLAFESGFRVNIAILKLLQIAYVVLLESENKKQQ